jgi:glutamine amidotransferase
MCRLLAYFSKDKNILYDLIFNYEHSIIKQSYLPAFTPRLKKNYLNCDINIDGFGIGWKNELNDEFCSYKHTIPIRNDINLCNILKSIKSECVFVHLRANTLNLCAPLSMMNTHPFIINEYMWMHNGKIGNFNKLKKILVASIDDDIFSCIKGNTDSEYCFGLYLTLLKKYNKVKAMRKLILLIKKSKIQSFLNFVVTNGEWIIATRCCVNTDVKDPISLYYNNKLYMVASEPLEKKNSHWKLVPKNSFVLIDQSVSNTNFTIKKIY